MAAELIEAVARVVVVVLRSAANEDFIGAVKIGTNVADEVGFPDAVVVVAGIVDREILW